MRYATTLRRLTLAAILLLALASVCGAAQPKNIILIIGDGMGIGAITAARCAGPGESGTLVLDTMPVTGLVKTHPEGKLVTDSAAAGTALATGRKTTNGRIATDPQNKTLLTTLEAAIGMGKSGGVITTDTVTGATPASFYAHTDARGKEDDIAAQLIGSKVTVAMGSGMQRFAPKDGKDLSAEARTAGFDIALDAKAMEESKGKRLLGLFSFDQTGPTLGSMLAKSVSVLGSNSKGFFLMAESCLPDKGGHKNDISISFQGVTDLENALRVALDFARKDGQTLVVVTADHDTGGLAVKDRENDAKVGAGWVQGGHTGNMVPVYAFGPGAEKFTGTHDNTDIPKLFAEMWGMKQFLGIGD